MDNTRWLVVGDSQEGPRGEWLFPPEPGDGRDRPVLFVGDPLEDSARARSIASALSQMGWRVLCVDTDSLSCRTAPAEARDGEPEWGRTEAFSDRVAVRELDRLAQAMGSSNPSVVGTGMGATWALLLGCQSRSVFAVGCIGARLIYPRLGATKPVQPLEMILNLDVPVLLVEDGKESDQEEGSIELAEVRFAAFGIPVEVVRSSAPALDDDHSANRLADRVHLFLSSTPTEPS